MRRTTESDAAVSTNPLILLNEGMIWLGVALLIGGLGWYKSVNLLLLLAYLMFTLLLVNGFLARSQVRRILAVRQATPPLYAGEDAVVRVIATNTGTRPTTVRIADNVGGEKSDWFIFRLPGGESTACSARKVFPTRGRFAGVPVRVSTGFPFGLIQYERAGGDGAEIVVLPAPGVADADGLRRWIQRFGGGEGRARKVLRRVTTDQADVRGVRPYRPGDSIRAIHWRSSARRRELMVREYDAAPAPELVLVVEPWLPANPTDAERDSLEASLSLAVTMARTWSRVYGTQVTIAVAGDAESIRTISPSDEGIREALAPLASVIGAADFAALGVSAFDRSLARSARILVSSRAASPHADDLTRTTGRYFIAISPADRLPWYQPPSPVNRQQSTAH
jgi:uncharacterized protein (DUF58 family)